MRLAGEPRHTELCSAHIGHNEPWPEKALGKEQAALGQLPGKHSLMQAKA